MRRKPIPECLVYRDAIAYLEKAKKAGNVEEISRAFQCVQIAKQCVEVVCLEMNLSCDEADRQLAIAYAMGMKKAKGVGKPKRKKA